MDLTSITPGTEQLKGLAHPVRMRMLGLLRAEGPATATALAARLGINTGATSYHLRQLAQHGYVVDDAERGNGRERWWQAAHQATRTGPVDDLDNPEGREALDAFSQAVAVVHTETLQRAVEERPLLPMPWRQATSLSDWGIRLTPARAQALVEALGQILDDVDEDADDEEDAAPFVVMLHSFPRPGWVTQDPS